MSLLRSKSKNAYQSEEKKKGNILQFFKKNDIGKYAEETDDEFEKNNKEFLKPIEIKQIKLNKIINENELNVNLDNHSDLEYEQNKRESDKYLDKPIKNDNDTVNSNNNKIKKCRKCNIEKQIDNFSKHKTTSDGYDNRCKECVKIMKLKINENIKKEQSDGNITVRQYIQNTQEFLDKLEPNLLTTEWQGGKLKGTYFKRKNAEKYTVCVEKKSVVVDTEEDAKNKLLELNKKYNCGKNMYRIIKYNNKTYVIMQLSNGYVGLFDFNKLDLLRKLNLSVTKTSENSNPNAKYYCLATINNRSAKIHNIITDYDMVDHINHYPLDNRFENLSLTNPKENNNYISKILNKKIEQIDNKYCVTLKYLDLNVKFNECKTNIDSQTFDTKSEAINWLDSRIKEIDTKRDYDPDVIEYSKSYEEIMIKYADGFKWCDNDETKDINKLKELDIKSDTKSEHNLSDKQDIQDIEENTEDNQKLSKLDKYKQFKDIDNDFTIQKYNINLKSNTISHLTYQDIEYKFCSRCNNWNKIDLFHSYNASIDGLYKYCKSCSKELRKENENTNSSTKQWKEKNKDKVAEYNKKYREENRDKLLESSRKPQEDKDKLKNDRKAKYYQDFKTKCEEHEGDLLSPESDYETAHTKLRVRCKNNHEFEITWNNCKNNKWCAQCRK